jgi:hypothetical protein
MKNWEIIADNLSKAGWNCGYISTTDHKDRQIGLWPQSAAALNISSCAPMKC